MMVKIETLSDLPDYGKFVLVNGVDEKTYGIRGWHVCKMDDLEDGVDFESNGIFYWMTENGTKISQVTHWDKLPLDPNEDTSFKVYYYSMLPNDVKYCHWTEGLYLVIEKDGITIELNGDEAQQLVNTLPRTLGGKY